MTLAERPWIILTLRRTGGTSLTTFLADVSKFPKIEHEPFIINRTLSHITRDFRETGDEAALRSAIDAALEQSPTIKHCVEIISQELTRALIDVCQARGYRFIVLTRRDEARRIGSLLLAVATDAWGSDTAADVYPRIVSGEIEPKPIEADAVRSRVRNDYYAIGRTLSLLRHRNIEHPWYLFEDLYFGDVPIAQQAVAIAADLGIDVAADDPRLQAFVRREGQKSTDIASHVPGYTEAMDLLRTLCAE